MCVWPEMDPAVHSALNRQEEQLSLVKQEMFEAAKHNNSGGETLLA